MKKFSFIALFPCMLLLSACSGLENFWYGDVYSTPNDYNFRNANVNAVLAPGQEGWQNGNYQVPRKYYVTADEQQQYNALNNRILKNQQKIQETNGTNSSTTTSLPSTTIPMNPNTTTYTPSSTTSTTSSSMVTSPSSASPSTTIKIPADTILQPNQ